MSLEEAGFVLSEDTRNVSKFSSLINSSFSEVKYYFFHFRLSLLCGEFSLNILGYAAIGSVV